MLKGQLSVGFIMQMALGFIILVALTYAAVGIQDSMKRETQKQALVMVVERVGTQVMGALGDLEPGQSIETVVMLPASSDEFGGQYGVSVESRHSRVYLRAQSMMWPELVARQPL